MVKTVAQIAKKAFDAVAKAIPDSIHECMLEREGEAGEYDAVSGEYSTSEPEIWTGRALVSTGTAIRDTFPDYVAGPTDVLIYLEGLSIAPLENDRVTIKSKTRLIVYTGDIVEAGTFFAMVAR
ncbi:MAG: hypothetical protein JKX85_02560 [Phycisphaeraceae bacterium]|nr:hypothetical protein [Phycisphaeraceae bacterium]